MADTITFYEKLFKQSNDLIFKHPAGLELARVGSILLIAGSDEDLDYFRETKVTFIVDSLQDFKNNLLNNGAELLDIPKDVPTGQNMRFKHPDGTIAEYVQFKS